MTEKLYDKDSYIKQFTATVISCEEYFDNFAVVLSKTAFFPEGGGQGSDRGFLDNAKVLDVQIKDDEIIHITDKALPVSAEVTGVIDFERRFDFMQQHSGEHIVSGVAHRLYGCENVGFHLGEDIVTLDFDKPLSKEQISQIEKQSNKAVFENRAFYTYYPDKETLRNLVYRSKKEIEGDIRIVEIEGVDMCACCAPHVKNSGEIGLIKLLGVENLRGGVRIELKCGDRALSDYNEKYENIKAISAKLCTKQNETADAVLKLCEQISNLKFEITSLKKEMLEKKVNAFSPEKSVTALFEDGLEIKELQHLADALYKKCGGIRAVFSQSENGFSFAICACEEELSDFFAKFKTAFSVRGGGRNGMVQGTVMAEKEEIMAFFI